MSGERGRGGLSACHPPWPDICVPPPSCCSSATASSRSWPWTCTTRWIAGRTTRVSGATGSSRGWLQGVPPPLGAGGRPGSGRSRSRQLGGGAIRHRRPLLPHSSGRGRGPFPPRKGLLPRDGTWGCWRWVLGPPPEPRGWGGQALVRFCGVLWVLREGWGGGILFQGRAGSDVHAKIAPPLAGGGHGAVPQRDLGVPGVGSPPPGQMGWLGEAIPVSTAGLRSQPQHAGPEPAPASCRPRGLPGVGTAPLGSPPTPRPQLPPGVGSEPPVTPGPCPQCG